MHRQDDAARARLVAHDQLDEGWLAAAMVSFWVTVVVAAWLLLLAARHIRRRRVAPLLELAPDAPERDHPSFAAAPFDPRRRV